VPGKRSGLVFAYRLSVKGRRWGGTRSPLEKEGKEMEREYGRPFDEDILIQQIGMRNVGAISGGRVGVYKPEGECVEVELPVSAGYLVRITLAWDDTYTVERVLRRRAKGKSYKESKVLGRVDGVYCDQVGEVAYYASCYKNVKFGQEVSA